MANEQNKQQGQAHLQGTSEGGGKPRESGVSAADLDAIKAELTAQFKAELKAQSDRQEEEFRVRMNEEREILHAQADAARADALAARTDASVGRRLDVPVLQDPATPSERRQKRPLPTTGVIEMELTHGSFVGKTSDKTYFGREPKENEKHTPLDVFAPARPGDVLKFDMAIPVQAKTAQLLRDNGCAERV